jgi:hypothetical protein
MAIKKYQMAIKYPNMFHFKTYPKLPNWNFWFENIHAIWQPCSQLETGDFVTARDQYVRPKI